jgi:hypothetical protein
LRRLLIIAVLLFTARAPAAVAFTSLTPDGYYDNGTGRSIYGASSSNGYLAEADLFIPSAGGLLTSVELALHYSQYSSPPGDQVDIRLTLDLNDPVHGHIPSSTILAAGTVTLPSDFGNFGLTTFTPSTSVLLSAGTMYWVVVLPHFTNTFGVWNVNYIGKSGPIAVSTDGVNWLQNPNALMDAFRVNVGPVPEPSSAALLTTALGLFWFRRRPPRSKKGRS